MGWGTFLGKIANQFQGREERRRNKIEDVEREMSEIQSKVPLTRDERERYQYLSSKLRQLYKNAKNA